MGQVWWLSYRNYTCWTRLSLIADQNNLVTLRPGGRRKEGYVATSADMVSLEMTPDPDKLCHALFLTVGDTWPKIFNKRRQGIFGQGTRLHIRQVAHCLYKVCGWLRGVVKRPRYHGFDFWSPFVRTPSLPSSMIKPREFYIVVEICVAGAEKGTVCVWTSGQLCQRWGCVVSTRLARVGVRRVF